MKPFKFFQKNIYKDKCRLEIGSSFIFRGDYCVVTHMKVNHFTYHNQSSPHIKYHMHYGYYLTTPSAAGRQCNR